MIKLKNLLKSDEKFSGLDILINNAGINLDNLSIRLNRRKLEKSY